ncbi:hypothetical protein [Flavobacterium sp.]|uniref:hypothetical protein n=1 Tax=Flavobacterium sp. TaxID=239 RepID=UPI0039E5C582
MADTPKSTFENTIELLKTLLWPVIILFFFFGYKTEIDQMIAVLPQKFENSSKFSVGSFSFEIEQKAKKSGNEELGEIIKGLSSPAIRKMITMGQGGQSIVNHTSDNSEFALSSDFDALLELEASGLVQSDVPLKEFRSYFEQLKPQERDIQSKTADGQPIRKTRRFVYANKLKPEQLQYLSGVRVALSEKGKKAFAIVLQVIGEQIKQ